MITIEGTLTVWCSKCEKTSTMSYAAYKLGTQEFCTACQPIPHPAGYTDWKRLYPQMAGAWRRDFTAFLNAVGDKPSHDHVLTRADSKKPYGPNNLTRWVLRSEYKRKPRTTKPKIPDYTIRYNAKRRRWLCGGHLFPTEASARAFAQENEF